ncbi:hypothetical protein [Halorubrum ezzemoulense]|uniref:hypothetical protein n=1 Tax=Halorubrum ezzemoulense TaxID=337243 RepID=UPI00113FF749|nr:hypothetical protein [Halorubrum ezzemoulense]
MTTELTKVTIEISEEAVVIRGENEDEVCLSGELKTEAPLAEAVDSLRGAADDLEKTGSCSFWAEE